MLIGKGKRVGVKIAFFDAKAYDVESFNATNQDFGFQLNYFSYHLNKETAPLTKDYDTVCIFVNDSLNSDVIDILYQNKIPLIALRASGYNNIDLKAVYGKIHVVRVPAYSPHSVAEHAVTLMLALNRKIHKAYNRTRENNFNIDGLLGFNMHGKTAGVVGTGQIGRAMIEILKGFGMKILSYDPFPDTKWSTSTGFNYVDLDTIYHEADIITLHCPLTRETHHLIGEQAISKMKPGVMIINTGRGRLIDSKALIDALKSEKVGSAGLDVYEEESDYFFEDFSNSIITDDILARLLSFNNVLITSHQAFFTKEALRNIALTTLCNIKDYFLNGKLENEICYKCGQSVCNKKECGRCFEIANEVTPAS